MRAAGIHGPTSTSTCPAESKREQVIQEIYRRYGRTGAAMTANVITYRGRSAMREVGKALGLSTDVMDRFSDLYASGDFPHTIDFEKQMDMAGIPAGHPRCRGPRRACFIPFTGCPGTWGSIPAA